MSSRTQLSSLLNLLKENSSCAKLFNLLQNKKINSLYSSGKYYDLAYKGYKGDVAFYKGLVKKSDTALYLGVGTGRIFGKIAPDVEGLIGVDYSKDMIRSMRKNFPMVNKDRVIIQNVFDLDFNKEHFDLIIAPFSFLTQFTKPDCIRLLKRIYKFLKKGGKFYTDFFSPYQNPKHTRLEIEKTRISARKFLYKIYHYLHDGRQLHEYTVVLEGQNIALLELKLRSFLPKEIRHMLTKAGFHDATIMPNFGEGGAKASTCELFTAACKKS